MVEIVKVKWTDASFNSDYWTTEELRDKKVLTGETVGYLVVDDKEKVVLAMEGYSDGEWRRISTIPKINIQEITRYRVRGKVQGSISQL